MRFALGGLAQLGERGVRNAEVEGSNPLPSTINNDSDLRDVRRLVAPGCVWPRVRIVERRGPGAMSPLAPVVVARRNASTATRRLRGSWSAAADAGASSKALS